MAGVAGGLQAADRLLAPAVAASLAVLDLPDADEAAVKLADTYARAIDEAKSAERWADKVLAKVDDESDTFDEVKALRLKLTARSALADLGPKLTALLVELGATPKARAAMAKGKPAQTVPDPASAGLMHLVQGVPPGA